MILPILCSVFIEDPKMMKLENMAPFWSMNSGQYESDFFEQLWASYQQSTYNPFEFHLFGLCKVFLSGTKFLSDRVKGTERKSNKNSTQKVLF